MNNNVTDSEIFAEITQIKQDNLKLRNEKEELKHQTEKRIADVQGYKYHETHRMIKRKCLKKIMK